MTSPVKFEPFICDHAAFLIGRRPWEVSRDSDLLFKAHEKAIDKYKLNLCIAGIDIYNAEAEALGCKVEEPDGNNSPTICQPLFSDISENTIENLSFDPETDGRLAMIIGTAARLKERFPDCAIRVPVCGPYSLAAHLFGIENLLVESMNNEETIRKILQRLGEYLIRYIRAIHGRKLHVAVFESTASPPLLSPALFGKLVVPVLQRIFAYSSSLVGERPAFIMGGHTLPIVESIMALRPSYIICPVETDQETFVARIKNAGIKDMRVRVNMSPAVFADETPARAINEAKRAVALACKLENSSVGLLLPFAASPQIIKAVSESTLSFAS